MIAVHGQRVIMSSSTARYWVSTERAACASYSAGCLDRCGQGPVIVIYPEETWYTYVDQSDLDEIIEEHLCHGRRVERLLIEREDII